jgi:hypothetical protein
MSGGKKLERSGWKTRTGEAGVVQTPAVFHDRRQTLHRPPPEERDAVYQNRYERQGMPAWQANKHQPSPLETSLPESLPATSVSAVKRCAAAVGEGGMAIAGVHMARHLGSRIASCRSCCRAAVGRVIPGASLSRCSVPQNCEVFHDPQIFR